MTPHSNRFNEMVLMMGHKIHFYGEIWLIILKLSLLPLLIWSAVVLKTILRLLFLPLNEKVFWETVLMRGHNISFYVGIWKIHCSR